MIRINDAQTNLDRGDRNPVLRRRPAHRRHGKQMTLTTTGGLGTGRANKGKPGISEAAQSLGILISNRVSNLSG